ncbi:MAG: signal recognition particle subunit SRP19/SEC65 family protein [Thermoplasmata archaeon]
MPPRKRKTWVIYPEYFDKRLSRKDGRRVPENLAIKSPTIEEINSVLNSYNIPNRIEKHKHHPSTWYEKRGRVLLSKQNISKQNFLKKLSEKMKNKRT